MKGEEYWRKIEEKLRVSKERLKVRFYYMDVGYWFTVAPETVKKERNVRFWYFCRETEKYHRACEKCNYWFYTYAYLGEKVPAICRRTNMMCVLYFDGKEVLRKTEDGHHVWIEVKN